MTTAEGVSLSGGRGALEQLALRQTVLAERSGQFLAERRPTIEPTTLQNLMIRLGRAMDGMHGGEWEAMREVGRWASGEKLAFEVLTEATHVYKRAALPWLVRAYPGVEGFVDGFLGLDELLSAALACLAEGYFGPD